MTAEQLPAHPRIWWDGHDFLYLLTGSALQAGEDGQLHRRGPGLYRAERVEDILTPEARPVVELHAAAVPDTGRPAPEPFLAQLRREQAAIDAHHARKASRRLHWVWDLGHRKPWRSSGPVPWRHLPSLFEWVRNAHDCSDASLMCSCAGSPRFPRRVEAL